MKFKKFVNTIMILIILLFFGFVFWLGIENRDLTENSVGIKYTKTSGWSNKILEPGKFSWSYEKVIPQNYYLHKFTLELKNIYSNVVQTLPSGKLYADYNDLNVENFNFNYKFSGSIKLKQDELYNLVNSGIFNEESFSEWENSNIENIKNIVDIEIKNLIIDDGTKDINKLIEDKLVTIFPYYDITNININLNRPDLVLYNSFRTKYLEDLEIKESANQEYLVESLRQKNEMQINLDLLEKYGELLTKYPILIEYLKIDNELALDNNIVENLIPLQNQR